MPSEKFWSMTAVEGDGTGPVLDVAWGRSGEVADVATGKPSLLLTPAEPGAYLNGERFDRSGLNRLIAALRKARDQTYGSAA